MPTRTISREQACGIALAARRDIASHGWIRVGLTDTKSDFTSTSDTKRGLSSPISAEKSLQYSTPAWGFKKEGGSHV
jgi:hypothetical protein